MIKQISKPLMEKKRRARINNSLEQLKSLLESQYPRISKRKLEKADILELTVKCLKRLQNSHQDAAVTKQQNVHLFHAGFQCCADRMDQFLLRSRPASQELRLELRSQLARPLQPKEPRRCTLDSASSTGNNGKFTEYQAVFRNCLNGVNQYLLTSDNSSGSVRLLKHLTNVVPGACGIPRSFSTLDSSAAPHVRALPSASNFLQQQHSEPAAMPFATLCKPHAVEVPYTSDKALSSTSVSNETIFVAQNTKQRGTGNSTVNAREQAGNLLCVSGQSKQNNAPYNVCSVPLNYWRPW
ncbi:hairy/enhancer-of-split related with YRPW motif protein 2-like [Polyodon spathula]|uniref:hairy/enhancer-of-split related with YRPW motif protein 2-like n=1 Tax=Polyodon spathula TaxID=7913 RepID=UPI001B7EBB05|nr:hairy/enhancer-of-split related with YRPW motif protein 2-like [Polyodon spathula]